MAEPHHRITTFYYPQPDGTIRFSRYSEALTEDGISMHDSGFITGAKADELRKKYPALAKGQSAAETEDA